MPTIAAAIESSIPRWFVLLLLSGRPWRSVRKLFEKGVGATGGSSSCSGSSEAKGTTGVEPWSGGGDELSRIELIKVAQGSKNGFPSTSSVSRAGSIHNQAGNE